MTYQNSNSLACLKNNEINSQKDMHDLDSIQSFDSVLRETKSLSFLRMGDGELRFLLESQDARR